MFSYDKSQTRKKDEEEGGAVVQSYNAAHKHAQKFRPQPSPEC
jgi:hypothetical protein